MRRFILVLAVGLVTSWAVAADAPPPVPREGTYAVTNVASGSLRFLPLGKDRLHVLYEVSGVSLSPTGEGLLHLASFRCMGGMHAVNGAYDDEVGSCVYTRPDGDQVFQTYRAAGKLGEVARGTTTVVGGTGKLAGIAGSGDFTRTQVRAAAEGTTQSVIRGTVKYRLP